MADSQSKQVAGEDSKISSKTRDSDIVSQDLADKTRAKLTINI